MYIYVLLKISVVSPELSIVGQNEGSAFSLCVQRIMFLHAYALEQNSSGLGLFS